MIVTRPPLVIIAAVDINGGYAKDGIIPWHHREDFMWFKRQTMGHNCIMGRKTYEDINARMGEKGKSHVLPGRKSFVISSTLGDITNATKARDINDACNQMEEDGKPVFIIGGGRLFTEAIASASHVILTIINKDYGTNAFFPTEFLYKHFTSTQIFKSDEDPDLRFVNFKRNNP